MPSTLSTTDSPDFPAHVRAAFTMRRDSLTAWAKRRGLKVPTVHAAVNGKRGGKKSRRIVAQLSRYIRAA